MLSQKMDKEILLIAYDHDTEANKKHLAKSMAAFDESEIVLEDGQRRNWRNDFVEKMLALQNEDGTWVNPESPRWWEGDPNLITGRIVVALNQALR